jgi:hypothetical protein
MKKIIFGSIAAVMSVIGLSSFKRAQKSFTTYYYWCVSTGSGYKVTFLKSDLYEYLGNTPTLYNPCNDGYVGKCLVGFTRQQVTGVGTDTQLKTSNGPKPNRITIYLRTEI